MCDTEALRRLRHLYSLAHSYHQQTLNSTHTVVLEMRSAAGTTFKAEGTVKFRLNQIDDPFFRASFELLSTSSAKTIGVGW